MARPITFEQAKAQFVHRFTMEHVPAWSQSFCTFKGVRKYYAPQFRTDLEWYENTAFKGEAGYMGFAGDCYTTGQTWPLGNWLASPFKR